MTDSPPLTWLEANQRHLTSALGRVREHLRRHSGAGDEEPAPASLSDRDIAPEEMPSPSALDLVCSHFGLSSFERDILLLCAGMEFDGRFPALCAAAQGDPNRPFPTFSLALSSLPEPHWSALAPEGPLRRHHLVEVSPAPALSLGLLRIDERILHYLAGIQQPDTRLAGIVSWTWTPPVTVPSEMSAAADLARLWQNGSPHGRSRAVQLHGSDEQTMNAIAATACADIGIGLMRIQASHIPLTAADLELFGCLLEREMLLCDAAVLIDCHSLDGSEATRLESVARLVARLRGPVALVGRDRIPLPGAPPPAIAVRRPTRDEQRELWRMELGESSSTLNGKIERLSGQFNLTAHQIRTASSDALNADDGDLSHRLWEACRSQARPRLDDLAQRIEPSASWDDLVLPAAQKEVLRDIAVHVRHRTTVYDTWGFAGKGTRGLGISALFAGASGTGKTMAAEVLANELHLDLCRIDLSSVVSKYIGETEKNLRRIFDVAEDGGAILLFDEADALFGKRSEVKDSHDRYANIEVSYLLQRMEAYTGLSILTTNLKSALDSAFLRRIRFVVNFPFPDAQQRAEIWSRVFPRATPTRDLDVSKLARLNVAGGNIRNIALNAAFLAADDGEPVGMSHLLSAAHTEYAKLEKPLTGAEIGGWE